MDNNSTKQKGTVYHRRDMLRGMAAGVGAMDRVGGHVFEREATTGLKYVDLAPLGAMDPAERIQRLDMENLERVFLYPTLSLFWIAECEDEDFTQAPELGFLARVFNQDAFNLGAVQEGLRAGVHENLTFANYQETKIRHWHRLLDEFLGA